MGWYHAGMGGPEIAGLLFLLATTLVIAGVYFATRLLSSLSPPAARRSGPQQLAGKAESPEEILDRRFAAGEIDQNTYIEHRSELNAQRAEYPGRS